MHSPASARTIVTVGDVMVDTLVHIADAIRLDADNPAQVTRSLGGQAANTAAWLRASDARVHLVGVLGDDSAARWVRDRVVDLDIAHTLVTVPGPTGECVIITSNDGTRTMFPSSGANALIGAPEVERELDDLIRGRPTHLHVSGYAACHDVDFVDRLLTQASSEGVGTSMDSAALTATSSTDHWRTAHLAVLPHVDILLATAREVQSLRGLPSPANFSVDDAMSVAADLVSDASSGNWPEVIVMKAGPLGAFVITPSNVTHVPAQAEHVADTTGAGDAFAAGFLAALGRGSSVVEAAQQGTSVAAVAVTGIGGQPAIREGHHGG